MVVTCGPFETDSVTKKFLFFSLLRELRDDIYDYAFTDMSISFRLWDNSLDQHKYSNGYASVMAMHQEGNRREPIGEFPSWLRYNMQLRREALEQFYRKLSFVIHF